MATKKTTKTKAETKAAVTIAEDEADVKRRQAHNENIKKIVDEKDGDIPHGKPLNEQSFEYVCDECLGKAAAMGDMFCLDEQPLSKAGRCACGKLTTNKAILI